MRTASNPTISGSSFQQYLRLARTNLRVLRARIVHSLTKSKLMTATIAGFLAGYMVIGYLLFAFGLSYVDELPLGAALSQRIFALLFFFFFLMLVFSNGVISYTTLYRNRETEWLLTLPVSFRALYAWKFTETLVFSSWGLVVISAPLLAAYGGVREAPPDFYAKALLLTVPFVAIPATVAAWLLVLAVRFINRWVIGGLVVAVSLWLLRYAATLFAAPDEDKDTGGNIVATLNEVLHHTELSVHPLMPSNWMTEALKGWSQHFPTGAGFFALLILSYALLGLLTVTAGAWRIFHPGYDLSLRRRAHTAWRRKQKRAGMTLESGLAPSRFSPLAALGARRSTRALLRKDFITFWRDPAQWVQFVIVFGLLFTYVLNLRNMGYDYSSPFWSAVIVHLNLGVCTLALSTLTTRFVFPQFSLEGRRLWILSMSPVSLGKIVIQKFGAAVLATGSLTVALVMISSAILELPLRSALFYASVVAMMSLALNALAVSLGTLFPNLREANPARIVSGFGGTLCLILSFLYIVLCIMTLVFPAAVRLAKKGFLASQDPNTATAVALAIIALLTALTAVLPLTLAVRKVKKVDFLRNL